MTLTALTFSNLSPLTFAPQRRLLYFHSPTPTVHTFVHLPTHVPAHPCPLCFQNKRDLSLCAHHATIQLANCPCAPCWRGDRKCKGPRSAQCMCTTLLDNKQRVDTLREQGVTLLHRGEDALEPLSLQSDLQYVINTNFVTYPHQKNCAHCHK